MNEEIPIDKNSEIKGWKNGVFVITLFLLIAIMIGISDSYLNNKTINNLSQNYKTLKSEYNIVTLNVKKLEKEKKELKHKISTCNKDSLVNVSREDLNAFLMKYYKKTSKRSKEIMLNEIFIQSEKYDINPLILFAIPHVESSYRPWIKHKMVRVKVQLSRKSKKTKEITTQAIGSCGVIWEFWKYKLIDAGIAEVKSDLFDPAINIRAMAFIFDYNRNLPLLKGETSKDKSAALRYFGITGDRAYYQKIDKFIGSLVNKKIYE